ncbi:hypothetical protein B0I35DRAFT_235851 [Stachybotrys elegans]|uniref:DUF676 domain-containing protein n=1 Tax=Stachybotrys elegans TaxID=80388 RepID=A0A8K0SR62_9HYPO|nr:hypothetical protein B0I35DRAFT_235851 [Stachybotrys elegans]
MSVRRGGIGALPSAKPAAHPRSPSPHPPPPLPFESVEKPLSSSSPSDTHIPFRFTLDPSGPLTHDTTTVDVLTVPCPGASGLHTWTRDGGRTLDVEGRRGGPAWVRQGIRREADRARILLYEHPDVVPGTTLVALADALLEELAALRESEGARMRPVLFIAHSLGGLVVKMALVKAVQDARYKDMARDCFGVAFFGTPHQGSSYFATHSLAASIQSMLHLSSPLPASLTDDLRVGTSALLHLDDAFKSMAGDVRVWTFYETIDSRLSSGADVYITAPLTSIKSAILGMRQERIFPLQSDHAGMASFGRHNVHTMRIFLGQLATQIDAAADAAEQESEADGARRAYMSLGLEQKVNVEVHGFFEDPLTPDSLVTTIRAWSTRLPLKDFLAKGPDRCLSERLNEVDAPPEESRFLRARGRLPVTTLSPTIAGLGITAHDRPTMTTSTSIAVIPPSSPVLRPVNMKTEPRAESAPAVPGIAPPPPGPPLSPPTRFSTPLIRPSPLLRAEFEQDLAIDRLSPPLGPRVRRAFSRSFSLGSSSDDAASRYEYRDFPPFSQRSRSDAGGGATEDEDADVEASPMLPESVVAIRKAIADGGRRTSETVVVEDVPSAFAKPKLSTRRFVWMHVPFNNPTWVKQMLETLQAYHKKDYSPLYNHDFWATRHTRGRHSQHWAYFAKPGCYFTSSHTLSPRSHSRTGTSISPPPLDNSASTCLFLPYLHFDSYKRLVRRREMILDRLRQGRSRPIPEYVAKSDSLELQVIWEYLGHDPPLNCRRTLDQYGYPSLRDTRPRDDDQMLYKLTKQRSCRASHHGGLFSEGSTGRAASDGGGSGTGSGTGSWRDRFMGHDSSEAHAEEEEEEDRLLDGNVLMVDQLWLWVINSHTVLTFFPRRESDPIEGPLYQQADLRDSIFNEVNVDLTRQCENALDLAALAALHAVSVLLDRSSHPDLEVFRIFEEAISVLNEKLTSSLKAFRTEGFRDKANDFEPVENKERSIRARHKEEGRRAERENRSNTSALLELRDIEDELLILLHLFERQSKVIASMQAVYMRPELRDHTVNGREFLKEALKRLGEYAHQAEEMTQRVRGTRDDYDKLLQMVQRQAQVDEVRLSRFHADLASAQSRSVMIFTTFTVIFLPLTFFTGLFGMNTREWGGENFPTLQTITTIAIPSSLALVVGALVVAWSTTVRQFLEWVSQVNSDAAERLYTLLWRPVARVVVRRLRGRRQGVKAEEREGVGRLKKEASDFWERHRLERERGYQIPEVNKKPAPSGDVRRAKSGRGGRR